MSLFFCGFCFKFCCFGKILKKGYTPKTVTYTSLVKGLCLGDKVGEAVKLFKKMVEFSWRPNIITYGTLINGLCRTRNVGDCISVEQEIANENDSLSFDFKANLVCYSMIIDGYLTRERQQIILHRICNFWS